MARVLSDRFAVSRHGAMLTDDVWRGRNGYAPPFPRRAAEPA